MSVLINEEKRVEFFANMRCGDDNSATIFIEIINNGPKSVNNIGATNSFKAELKTI